MSVALFIHCKLKVAILFPQVFASQTTKLPLLIGGGCWGCMRGRQQALLRAEARTSTPYAY